MCSFNPDGYSEVWREKFHKSRKYRRCYSCSAITMPGERYLSIFSVFEGDASTFSLCELCGEAMQAFMSKHGSCQADVVTMLDECASDGEHDDTPTEDPWRYWLFLIELNERRSKWAFGAALSQALAEVRP